MLVSRGPDGSMNWDHLVRTDSAWRTSVEKRTVSGVVHVVDGSLTFEDRSDAARLPVFLRFINAGINLPPKGGVYELLSATAQLGSDKPGTILLKGSMTSEQRDGLKIEQNLMVRDMDVDAVSRELGPDWVLTGHTGNLATFERHSSVSPRPASRPST